MSVYAIGDIQGCYDALGRLLDRIRFDPQADRLWFTGDMVNRGPRSLETLRFVKSLGGAAVTVLGNHDLHLLAVAAGCQRARPSDTLDAILAAPDRDELLNWLRRRPLAHYDAAYGYLMVHAGLAPQWTPNDALALAAEVEARLAAPDWTAFLIGMYGNAPARWDPELTGIDRLRAIVNYLTRLRFCTPDGTMDFDHKGPPGTQPAPLVPWFAVPARNSAGDRIVCGHWSAVGAGRSHNVYLLDSGCAWGGALTALQLDGEERWFKVECDSSAAAAGKIASGGRETRTE
ncbi:MAG TPA: symmetrical bis(5'-nucleosyl)-tetraphosphatase [Gammaproteobacteria bacterium]|nr:symmetrical bis(5'-nucleosyl)-tetraphosphatase [Gammaproteobacteria bacterium]